MMVNKTRNDRTLSINSANAMLKGKNHLG
jgi:hypothetical protein